MPKAKESAPKTPTELMKFINKKMGAGTMIMANDDSLIIRRIPCGILSVDVRLGGGFARGRHIEVYGPWSVGKTYLLFCLIAQAQANGLHCAYIDCEGTFSRELAELAGVDVDALAYHRQEHGNKVVDFMETLLRSEMYAVIGMDSIAALLPQPELESEMGAGSMGMEQAKLMSKALRKLTAANKSTVLFYINQQREAVGSIFAKKMTTSGGRAMGFYAGTRLELVRTENIKEMRKVIDEKTGKQVSRDTVIGHRVLVRVEKDKTGARPASTTTFVFNYELGGADPTEDLMFLGREYGLIHMGQGGNMWWVEGYEDEKQNGRKRFRKWLSKNRAVADELDELIREKAQEDPELEDEEDDDEDE